MPASEPRLYYWEERNERRATLVFDSGYRDNGQPMGFIYVYELNHSRPASELADEISALGTPTLQWRLVR